MTRRIQARRPGRLAPGVALAVLILLLTGCATGALPSASVPAPSDAATSPARVVPSSLRIPSLDLEQDALLRMGIAPDGTIEVPADYDRVGWFDRGPVPGYDGATVLLGHVDSRSGPAVFYELRELRPGDALELGRSDGTMARYVVRRTEQVAKDRFPTVAVFGATREDVVRLVTCAGEFDRGARSYTDNLVVHAVRA